MANPNLFLWRISWRMSSSGENSEEYRENTVALDAPYWISRLQNEDMYVKFIFIRIFFLTLWSVRTRAKTWIWEKEMHSHESNIF